MATDNKKIVFEKVLKALANRRRLAVLEFLKHRHEASVSEIARGIHLSVKATSKHLGLLSGAGIIEKEQRSLLVFYRLKKETPECAASTLLLL
jgi:DNA-binding transcriptional ArsR family regulator